MDKRLLVAAIAALALASCQKSEDKAPPPAPAPTPTVTATAMPVAAAKPTCDPAPKLDESDDFSDPRDVFTVDAPEFAKLEANFAAAYRKVCDSGLFAKTPLIPANAPHPGTLFAITAPDSNEASIYQATDDTSTPGDMVLEYYFITADGKLHVPSEADLSEAMYCAVHGATQQEEDETGRCLVD